MNIQTDDPKIFHEALKGKDVDIYRHQGDTIHEVTVLWVGKRYLVLFDGVRGHESRVDLDEVETLVVL